MPDACESPAPLPGHVAIIGAGFSGTAVLMHLLSALPPGTRISLFERGERLARGVAYGTYSPSHWLNVPAGRLGWHPDDEGGFHTWLQSQRAPHGPADFVPRSLLGDYLASELDEARRIGQRRGLRLEVHHTEVVDLEALPGHRHRLVLDGGDTLSADVVVLATGHLPPVTPPLNGVAWGEPGVVADPWSPGALAELPEQAALLVLGTGLTAIDMLTGLQDRGHAGPVMLLSRRGLLPHPHRSLEARPRLGLSPVAALGEERRLRAILQAVRRWVAEAEADGRDWRDVMASLRACTPSLWQRLSLRDRCQFLRHLQPWWDTHRHRLAPGIQRRLEAALKTGQARAEAGRVLRTERLPDGRMRVVWRPRGGTEAATTVVSAILNCTGASTSLQRADAPLLQRLRDRGWLTADALDLGLLVDERHRPANDAGQGRPGLYYVGPMLKAQRWEAIAIPELREHARDVAEQVLAALAARRAAIPG